MFDKRLVPISDDAVADRPAVVRGHAGDAVKHGVVLVGYSPFDNLPERGELALVAGELKATPRQVALAFLTRLPDTFAIPKASRVAHVRENAGAAKLKLTKEQVARLERAYPIRIRSELPVS